MNSKLIPGIVVIIIVAVAAVIFVVRHKDGAPILNTNTDQSVVNGPITKESGSIKSLLAAGKNQKCTFATSADGFSSSGTVYFGSGKARGDFANSSSPSMYHLITDGQTNNVWSDDGANEQAQKYVDINRSYDWQCQDWAVDNSKFQK